MIKALRHAAYRFKYVYGNKLPLTVPVDVSLELASQCNMACTYCYHSKENEENLPFVKGLMSLETATEILVQAADLGVHSVKMNYRGESTINPHFSVITGWAKSLASGSTFIERLTNSNFKFRSNREDIFDGLANQTKVKISYDSFIKGVFEKQRAGGDHALTTKNIDIFYNHPARIKSETEMVIQAVRTTANANEDIEAEARRRWPEATVSIRDMVGGRLEKDLSNIAVRHRDFSDRQACTQAFVRLMFDWQGNAGACCPDIGNKIQLGNIHKKSMTEIFNGVAARSLRGALKSGAAFASEPCKSCSSFESFKGYKPNWKS